MDKAELFGLLKKNAFFKGKVILSSGKESDYYLDARLVTLSAADPLNLTGIITAGDRVRSAASNRIVYRNGVPVAAMEGDMLRMLDEVDPAIAPEVAAAAAGRRVPVLSGYVGRIG